MSKKIAICSTGSAPSSMMDERFGRCRYFMIWDPEAGQYETLSNSGTESAHGAGTGAVQELVQREVGIVIAQRVGPKALTAIQQAGIKVFTDVADKTVDEARQRYETDQLPELPALNN